MSNCLSATQAGQAVQSGSDHAEEAISRVAEKAEEVCVVQCSLMFLLINLALMVGKEGAPSCFYIDEHITKLSIVWKLLLFAAAI